MTTQFSSQEILNRVFDDTNNRLNVNPSYEEGTWTPVAAYVSGNGDLSYAFQAGFYTKIGRLVTVTCRVRWTETTASGNLSIAGLPFTSDATANHYATCAIAPQNLTGAADGVQGVILPGTTEVQVWYGNDGSATNLTHTHTGTNATFSFSLTYFT